MASPQGTENRQNQSRYSELLFKKQRAVNKKLKKIAEIEGRIKNSHAHLEDEQRVALSKKPELLLLAREYETMKQSFNEFDEQAESTAQKTEAQLQAVATESKSEIKAAIVRAADFVLALVLAGRSNPSENDDNAAVVRFVDLVKRLEQSSADDAAAAAVDMLEAYVAGGDTPSAVLNGSSPAEVAADATVVPATIVRTVIDEPAAIVPENETAESPIASNGDTDDVATEEASADSTENAEDMKDGFPMSSGSHHYAGTTTGDLTPTADPVVSSLALGPGPGAIGTAVVAPAASTQAPPASNEPDFEFMVPSVVQDETERIAHEAVFNDPAVQQVHEAVFNDPAVQKVYLGNNSTSPDDLNANTTTDSTPSQPPNHTPLSTGDTTSPDSNELQSSSKNSDTSDTNKVMTEATAADGGESTVQGSSKGRGGKKGPGGRGRGRGGRGRGRGQNGGPKNGRGEGGRGKGGRRGRGDGGRHDGGGRGRRGGRGQRASTEAE